MPTSADVPSIYDVVLNSEGYIYDDVVDVRAQYSFSPTFLERTNVSGSFGDNDQDFFFTVSQNNWVTGEQQLFAHVSDPETMKAFWRCSNVEVNRPGQVSLYEDTTTTSASTTTSILKLAGDVDRVWAATSTKLYMIVSSTTFNDRGAHGLGTSPLCIVSDGQDVYMSSSDPASVGVRKWDESAFSTFSATKVDALEYHNNSLYGFKNSTAELYSFSSAGAGTVVSTLKAVDGGAAKVTTSPTGGVLRSYGGKLLLAFQNNLYQYDGVGLSALAKFPTDFHIWSIDIVDGIVVIGGIKLRQNLDAIPSLYYYNGGVFGNLWEATEKITASANQFGFVNVVSYSGGAVFNDDSTGRLLFWNPSTGSISGIGAYTANEVQNTALAACQTFFIHSRQGTTAYLAPDNKSSGVSTSGYITSSLYDFDNTLTKQFRGIKVDFVAGTDGNGGTVDIAYRIGDVDGSYTTLQTGATSGTEYTLTGVSGQSISVKITLNKGTSTNGPVLKRVYVRAAPVLQSFKQRTYRLRLKGRNSTNMAVLRNGTAHTKDGATMVGDLQTAAAATAPFSITDHLGTFTGVIDSGGLVVQEVAQDEYVAMVKVREV